MSDDKDDTSQQGEMRSIRQTGNTEASVSPVPRDVPTGRLSSPPEKNEKK